MYPIPLDLDLSSALGQFTTQIRVGKYDLQFSFGSVHFQSMCKVILIKNESMVSVWKEGEWPEAAFLDVYNVNLSHYEIPNERLIILKLENELEIHLPVDDDQYECLSISIDNDIGPWYF